MKIEPKHYFFVVIAFIGYVIIYHIADRMVTPYIDKFFDRRKPIKHASNIE